MGQRRSRGYYYRKKKWGQSQQGLSYLKQCLASVLSLSGESLHSLVPAMGSGPMVQIRALCLKHHQTHSTHKGPIHSSRPSLVCSWTYPGRTHIGRLWSACQTSRVDLILSLVTWSYLIDEESIPFLMLFSPNKKLPVEQQMRDPL